MNSHSHARHLRKGRHSQPFRAYSITIGCYNRTSYLSRFELACAVCRALHAAEARKECLNYCFVVMPDHLHWLMALGDTHSLSQVVRMVKSHSARMAGVRLWQRGFYDHALRSEADLLPAARYIIANPLRAGLVSRVGDYPYWDALWL